MTEIINGRERSSALRMRFRMKPDALLLPKAYGRKPEKRKKMPKREGKPPGVEAEAVSTPPPRILASTSTSDLEKGAAYPEKHAARTKDCFREGAGPNKIALTWLAPGVWKATLRKRRRRGGQPPATKCWRFGFRWPTRGPFDWPAPRHLKRGGAGKTNVGGLDR